MPSSARKNGPLKRLQSLASAIILLSLSGCELQPLRPLDANISPLWVTQSKQLESQQQWHLQGRIGIRLPEEALSASILWHQNNEQSDIRLTGPLGQGGVRIKGDDQEVQIADAKSGAITQGNPEHLLTEKLGYPLPLNQLSRWCLGLIETSSTGLFSRQQNEPIVDLMFDPQGMPSSFRTESWHVKYQRWKPVNGQAVPTPYVLPHKIILQSDAVKITLAIKRWNFVANNDT